MWVGWEGGEPRRGLRRGRVGVPAPRLRFWKRRIGIASRHCSEVGGLGACLVGGWVFVWCSGWVMLLALKQHASVAGKRGTRRLEQMVARAGCAPGI